MRSQTIDLVAGARPNFMKIAPLYHALKRAAGVFAPRIIHTGQHYDANLSEVFFADLNLPRPDHHLGVGSGAVATQTARVLQAYDELLAKDAPAITLVVGDVNSTVGCGLAAVHHGIPLVHLEAGLRSFDRTMPEEVNRVLTDRISDLLLTPSADADLHLRAEGIDAHRIRFVGNIMIDSLEAHLERARTSTIVNDLGLAAGPFALCTLHRPANVDDPGMLSDLLGTLAEIASRMPVILPAHPRLKKNVERLDARVRELLAGAAGLRLVDPVGYVEFLALEAAARVVLSDSGGVQEETTVLGVPCLTLRDNTERPVTISHGTNRLVGRERARILAAFEEATALPMPGPKRPPLWDGRTADRVVEALTDFFLNRRQVEAVATTAEPVCALPVPSCEAHRSSEVRRELLLVAETGDWQSAPDAQSLRERLAAYAQTPHVLLCGEVAGGFAALRAHYSAGPVAILGGTVPDDVAAALNGSAVRWPSLSSPLPAGCKLVYVPPFAGENWRAVDTAALCAWAKEHADVLVAVDERWYEYTQVSVGGEVAAVPNLIALRSLAPAFGLDGLGAGYMVAAPDVIATSVAAAAEASLLPVARRATMVALIDQGYMREYVETRSATRRWLQQALTGLGYTAQELPGPHLFVRGDIPASMAALPCTCRVNDGWLWAVGTPEQVEDCVAELQRAGSRVGS
jgi:UDP-N-acetylglucosamine 2-epimerase (non-hydrolysing)